MFVHFAIWKSWQKNIRRTSLMNGSSMNQVVMSQFLLSCSGLWQLISKTINDKDT